MNNNDSTAPLRAGSLVTHLRKPDWGLGKVIREEGEDVFVYFKGHEGSRPEDRVVRLRALSSPLDKADPRPDVLLDNLPPYDGKQFIRSRTQLRLERAKDLFLKHCPKGFGGEAYLAPAGERVYKVAAHERFVRISVDLPGLAGSGSAAAIRGALHEVYAGPRGASVEGLNLMHPRFEAPHYFSALDDEAFARRFLASALGFLDHPDRAGFERYASAVEEMQWIEGKGSTGLWPLLSWLPFVADPSRHMMIRPTVVRDFASLLPFDIRLDSALDFDSYQRILTMSGALGEALTHSEVNLSGRPLDLIDLQSFMWVALRIFQPDALEAGH